MDHTDQALAAAYRHATTFLQQLDVSPVAATATRGELRDRLGLALPECGTPAAQVIDELAVATAGGQLGSAGGRFFGWVIGGALPWRSQPIG